MDYFAPIGVESSFSGGRPRSLATPLSPELQAIPMPATRTSNPPPPQAPPPSRPDGHGSGSPIAFPSGAVTTVSGIANIASPPARPVKSPRRSRAASEIFNVGKSGGVEGSSEERHLIVHKDGGRVPSVGTSGEGMTGESGTGNVTGEESGDGEGLHLPAYGRG